MELKAKHPRIGDVRGLGLMIGIQWCTPGTTEWDTELRDQLIQECFNRGLLVLGAGSSTIGCLHR